jgi:anti-anti-sigma factor
VNITVEKKEIFHIVRMNDRLTVDTDIKKLIAVVEGLLGKGYTKIVLNFTPDSYLCTRSISAILQCNNLVGKHGGVLGILQPGPEIRDSLETTGIDSLIRIFESVENIL